MSSDAQPRSHPEPVDRRRELVIKSAASLARTSTPQVAPVDASDPSTLPRLHTLVGGTSQSSPFSGPVRGHRLRPPARDAQAVPLAPTPVPVASARTFLDSARQRRRRPEDRIDDVGLSLVFMASVLWVLVTLVESGALGG